MACGSAFSIDISICLCMLVKIDRYAQIINHKESGEIETCVSTYKFMLLRVHIHEYINGRREREAVFIT